MILLLFVFTERLKPRFVSGRSVMPFTLNYQQKHTFMGLSDSLANEFVMMYGRPSDIIPHNPPEFQQVSSIALTTWSMRGSV